MSRAVNNHSQWYNLGSERQESHDFFSMDVRFKFLDKFVWFRIPTIGQEITHGHGPSWW